VRFVVAIVTVVGLALLAAPRQAAAQERPRDQLDPTIGSTEAWTLAIWSEDRGQGSRIMARRLDLRGQPLAGASGSAFELAPAVAPDGHKGDQRWPVLRGGYLVWSEKLPGASDYDIYMQRLDRYARPYRKPVLIAGGPGDQTQADLGGI
jgi:hypothetical protein